MFVVAVGVMEWFWDSVKGINVCGEDSYYLRQEIMLLVGFVCLSICFLVCLFAGLVACLFGGVCKKLCVKFALIFFS